MSSSPPHVIEDCRGQLQVLSDGSIRRSPAPPSFRFPLPSDDVAFNVDWKDLRFSDDLHLRLYKPRAPLLTASAKLPVFYYFHGGGFCIGSRTWPNFHNCCLVLSAELPALVVAPDYRLAPENRLPAAVDDAIAAVQWLRDQSTSPDPWLAEAADFGRVFISGESAGGNLVHQLAVQFSSSSTKLDPVRIRGFVLLLPFFGGTQLTRSEAECPDDAFLNRAMCDRYWRLALPPGATVDHQLANPFGPGSQALESAYLGPMLVVVGEKDLLRDRAVEYARRLKERGIAVKVVEAEGQQHAFFGLNPWSEPVHRAIKDIRHFMDEVVMTGNED